MASELERIAFEAATRALDKQERVLEELRARTGLLVAVSSLAVSFLGRPALEGASDAVTVFTLVAFAVSIAASVYILLPKETFYFALSGPAIFEGSYEFRDDGAEIHRRLAYDMQRFWDRNDVLLHRLLYAAGALAVEIALLLASLGGSLL